VSSVECRVSSGWTDGWTGRLKGKGGMDLAVAIQKSLGDEGLGASGALIGSLPRMVAPVYDQGRVLGEGLAAGLADVGPLPRVGPLVHDEGRPLVEGLAAHLAAQALLAPVEPQVILERALGRYGLAAQVTVVLVLPGVGLHVGHQRVPIGESLAAELALVLDRLEVRLVAPRVSRERMAVGQRLAADLADVFLGPVSAVHVAAQLRVREEALAAEGTVARVPVEVPPLVIGQLRGLDEGPAAHVTDEVALARVDAPVDGQRVGALEGL
jgi:hypothetical protein